jgi:hypothetical protein
VNREAIDHGPAKFVFGYETILIRFFKRSTDIFFNWPIETVSNQGRPKSIFLLFPTPICGGWKQQKTFIYWQEAVQTFFLDGSNNLF